MADGGISEVAIAAAAAEASAAAEAAAAAGTAATIGATAATAADVAGAAGAGLAGTAAETAAAAAPEIAATAAPEIAAATPAVADAPFLGATASEPLLGPTVAAPTVAPTTVPETSLLGGNVDIAGNATTLAGPADPVMTVPQIASPATDTVDIAGNQAAGQGLLGQLGNWWDTTSVGDKLKAGGTLLSGASAAKGAATPAPSKGPTHTIQPGQVGRPQGGEQQIAALVDAMLKKRDAYQSGQLGGVPIAYRPRGLLG